MVRVVIPPGFTWEVETGHPIEGPWELVSDQIALPMEVGAPKETVINGEYVLHTDGTFYRSMTYTREETAITVPLAFSMVVCLLVHWLRRAMVWAVFLSPLAASAATFRMDAQTGISISWPSGLSGASVQGWAVFPGGAFPTETSVTPTVTGTVNGKPAMVSVPLASKGANWYYVITNGGSGTYESKTKLKWIDPYEVGNPNEPQSNDKGDYNGTQPILENGTPISDPSNPVADTGPHKGNGDFKNPFGHPATPILKITPKDGSPPKEWRWPQLQPGQQLPWDHTQDGGFDWEVGWDIGDGVKVWPGGPGNTGTAVPVPGPGPTPGTPPNVGPPVTSPITTPPDAPSGDVAAAVNRHAALTQAYGDAARTASNISNNNLDKLKELFGEAVSKLGDIKNNTAAGTGMDGVTIEGEALDLLGDISSGINGPGVEPPKTEPPAVSVTDWSSKAKASAVQRIKDSMQSIGNSMQFAKSSLGLGANYSSLPMTTTITVFNHTYYFNFETHAWAINLLRQVIFGIACIFFVWRFFKILGHLFS